MLRCESWILSWRSKNISCARSKVGCRGAAVEVNISWVRSRVGCLGCSHGSRSEDFVGCVSRGRVNSQRASALVVQLFRALVQCHALGSTVDGAESDNIELLAGLHNRVRPAPVFHHELLALLER